MSAFETRPLNPEFGVEVTGINLADATNDRLFGQVRALFEEHSALLFRDQDISDDQHKQLAELFGPIEDRKADERKKGENSRFRRFPMCGMTVRLPKKWTCTR